MSDWKKETVQPAERRWEEFYRNRFQHDKRVRTTHGVNCTGSCSWEVFVKDGIVTWELQATDYPQLEAGLPPYEPRGCQRGISFSWYLYSPLRVKYPYVRGALLDLWRAERAKGADPVEAWARITADPERRRRYQEARGKGGYRRVRWDEALDIVAAATVHTVKEHGPDRIAAFSPIPAMSQISYAAGSRFASLVGGAVLSFYDWYCDLPPASPETWGEQTDVHESADWYNARFIAVMGSNINMTRTPDAHFLAEVRHAGARLTVFSPDFSQVAKYADWWIPVHAGQDTAFWMAVNHVILKEFYVEKQVPFFLDYLRRFTDTPFLVEIVEEDGRARPGRYLRAAELPDRAEEEHADWKLLMWDESRDAPAMPKGTLGYRWAQKDRGKWNLQLEDGATGEPIRPRLSFADAADEVVQVAFEDFQADRVALRGVPVRVVQTRRGAVKVTTVFDLLMARFGVGRGLPGEYPASYDDEGAYTPAWQEATTGIHRDTVIRFARAWADNGARTKGRNLVIIGAGVNHWYHNNLLYRSAVVALMLTGSVGTNGGGLAHYVGQEKVVNIASWAPIAFAGDWGMPPRHQNTPSFHYVHSDQWRYERGFGVYDKLAGKAAHAHTIDQQVDAVRRGWLPFFPQFDRSSLAVAKEAREAGAGDDGAVVAHVVDRLRRGDLKFAVQDPDAPENWPRLWFIWRGNAIGTSAKGHEYFLKHYLGTHTGARAEELARDHVEEVVFRDEAPRGKMDLVVNLNFRMDTTALYSDVLLPAATWYEKDDLNTTDMHSFIHPMQQVVPPAWESRSDWDIFKAVARRVSELAEKHLPEPVEDVVMLPLQHDTPDEIAQPRVGGRWWAGEVEAVPGRTMPKFRVVKRDYTRLYERMVSMGPGVEKNGVAAHGLRIPAADMVAELKERQPIAAGGETRVSLEEARQVAEAILHLDPASNGELAWRGYKAEEAKTGVPLVDIAEETRGARLRFSDIVARPRRVLSSPTWSGLVNRGRAYSPYTVNVERLVPWRTLTGRQHFYLDHDAYLEWGEHLPVFKPRPEMEMLDETRMSRAHAEGARLFNYITPHGKWSIHSTYGDNLRMMTLSRGGYPVWMNDRDAAEMGIRDNDWVEVFNDNGVFVQRCVTSARIPRGAVFVYHATERTVGIPKSPMTGKRAGMNNSITRARLKPVLMSGGYAQFTYFFNYWGPTGVNRDTFAYVRRIEKPEF